jgi:hypothetical protein
MCSHGLAGIDRVGRSYPTSCNRNHHAYCGSFNDYGRYYRDCNKGSVIANRSDEGVAGKRDANHPRGIRVGGSVA